MRSIPIPSDKALEIQGRLMTHHHALMAMFDDLDDNAFEPLSAMAIVTATKDMQAICNELAPIVHQHAVQMITSLEKKGYL